jgi:hypothetical protein
MTRDAGAESMTPDVRRLAEAGDVRSLIPLLAHPDPRVQWHAAGALGTCGERAVPLLLDALKSRSAPARLGAIEALAAIRDPRAVTPIIAVLRQEPVPEVRWAAALALGELGSLDAAPFLVPLLRDPSRYLRYGAAAALGRLGWEPKDEAETAYVLIARQDWEAVRKMGPAAIPYLAVIFRKNDPGTRGAVASVLQDTGSPRAQDLCRQALRDRDPRVRWNAVLASLQNGLAARELPLMVARRERTGPDPAVAALLNFLFLGIGYNYLGRWWGFPVFMSYMSVLVLAQLAVGPFIPYLIAYPVTALFGIHTYYLADRMSDL